MKNKPSSGAGMLSATGLAGGLSGGGKPKTLGLAPPPSGTGKIRSPLPPPPNDPAAARMTSASRHTALKDPKEGSKHSTDPLSDFSQLEVSLLSILCCFLLEFSNLMLFLMLKLPSGSWTLLLCGSLCKFP